MVNIANTSLCHRDIACPCNFSWISFYLRCHLYRDANWSCYKGMDTQL